MRGRCCRSQPSAHAKGEVEIRKGGRKEWSWSCRIVTSEDARERFRCERRRHGVILRRGGLARRIGSATRRWSAQQRREARPDLRLPSDGCAQMEEMLTFVDGAEQCDRGQEKERGRGRRRKEEKKKEEKEGKGEGRAATGGDFRQWSTAEPAVVG
ncbi:hypothetical protein E2542_SST21500 [Spatholobus suberectus]|nr:hypothetical protein E2542_SST21500 [Spatholobus suberectus]